MPRRAVLMPDGRPWRQPTALLLPIRAAFECSSEGDRRVFEPGPTSSARMEDAPVRPDKHTTSPDHFLLLTAGRSLCRMYAVRGHTQQSRRIREGRRLCDDYRTGLGGELQP